MCLYPLAQSNLYRSAATVHDHSSAGIELLPPSFLFLTPFLSYSLLCLPPCQLALVAITDHHTRIVAGGSTLPPTAPCVGLLFGQQDGLKVTICDAVETEHSFASTAGEGDFGGGTEAQQAAHRSSVQTKIELHQKVFPSHECLGWYRVGKPPARAGAAVPTEQDLRTNTGRMRDYNESPLFLLMHSGGERRGGNSSAGTDLGDPSSARERLDRDEQLPVAIYETLVAGGEAGGSGAGSAEAPRAVFVNLDFDLEMSEPERIAVEKVFQEQPSATAAAAAAAHAAAAKAAADKELKVGALVQQEQESGDKAPGGARANSAAAGPSQLDAHLRSIRSAIGSMNDRVDVLLDYLGRVEVGEVPPDPSLLRQIDSLVLRLPLLASADGDALSAALEAERDSALLLSHLAALTKTARAARVFSEKHQLVTEGGSKEALRRSIW